MEECKGQVEKDWEWLFASGRGFLRMGREKDGAIGF